MSKARELADVIGTQDTTENVLQGRKNLIINGAMQVWQRGTSFTGIKYTADRFESASSGNTVTQSTDVPSGEFVYSLKTANASAGAEIFTNVELSKVGSSAPFDITKTYTLSFYAKASASMNLSNACYFSNDGIGNGAVTYKASATVAALTTSWQRFTVTIPANSISIGASNACFLMTFVGATTGVDFYLTGVQLELGSVATPFEHRSYGEELALCKRYYYKEPSDAPYRAFTSGVGLTTADCRFEFELPVVMRSAPTFSSSGNFRCAGSSNINITTFGVLYASKYGVNLRSTDSGFTVGYAYLLQSNNDASAALIFDAEL